MTMTASKLENSALSHPHLTGIAHLADDDIGLLLERARYYAELMAAGETPAPVLRGKIIFSLFFEASTRTRMSFEVAAKRLGADIVNWASDASSLKKGESFNDTILNLNAMGPDGIILRHSEFGAPDYVAKRVGCPVINAGDSWREHPTQALLDALTIRQAKGRIEGLTVAICGDIAHSRVANSNMILLHRLGAKIRVIAPAALLPRQFPVDGVAAFDSPEDGLQGADIVMALRLQKERMQEGLIDSDAAYFNRYGLTLERLAHAKPEALVMHPGPMNRGVEIADEVADDPHRSLILKQVGNGVAVRMAVLDLLLEG